MTARGPTDFPAAPRLTRALLALRVPRAEREFVKGDLDEGYAAQYVVVGAWRARLWYWRQLFSILGNKWGARPPERPQRRRRLSLGGLAADVRFAVRSLRCVPVFSTIVVATLTVGIGATSAVFSVVYPIVLAEPPYPDADRLVMVWEREADGTKTNLGYLTGDDIRRETKSFDSFAMMAYWGPTVRVGNDVQRLQGARVTHEYFATLGIRPRIGRDFSAEEDAPETRRVLVLSNGLWRRQFGGDSSVIGTTAIVNGVAFAIVGVMPADYTDLLFPQAEVWTPLGYTEATRQACRTCRHLRGVARLRDGVTRDVAESEMDALMHTLRSRHPDQYGGDGALVPTLQSDLARGFRNPMFGLLAAVALLLMLACANVVSLFLGRTGERQNDFAIRRALGAERGRLVRLVGFEAGILTLVGGTLGLLAAWLGTKGLLVAMDVPAALTRRVEMVPMVAVFAIVVTTVAALIGAVLPALLALRESALRDIRVSTRAVVGRVRHRMRNAVVITEVALAVLLLAAAGLQVRSVQRAIAVETGFDPVGVLTMQTALAGPQYATGGAANRFYRELLDGARSVPQLRGAAVTSQLPLGGNFDASGVHREDRPAANPQLDPSAQRFAVSPSYLDVMRIRVLRGRGFTEHDREGAPLVVLINQSGAERIFAPDDPLGKRVKFGGINGPWYTVVGVVEDVRHLSLERAPESQMYLPFDQNSFEMTGLIVVARSSASPAAIAQPLTDIAKRLDAGVAVASVRDMEAVVSAIVAPRQLVLSLVGGFAVIAIVLALGGLYGVMSASVAERVREMGLRSALGATPGSLVRLIVSRGLMLAAIGTTIGTAALLAAWRIVERFVFGVSPGDPATLVGVAALLALIAMVASALPAFRAARVDPIIALRQ